MFFPLDKTSEEFVKFKNNATKSKEKDFILFFNSRNIRRKSIPDALLAWKYFIDTLPKEKADKCLFILHTELVSEHGTDLQAVHNYIFGESNTTVQFSTQKLSTQQMNQFYNLADAQILLSSAEGWGLSLTEALLTGTPFIANVTGGMQDQMRFEDKDGNWIDFDSEIPSNHTGAYQKHGKWAFPVFPSNLSLVGSPQTPYIWDDRCDPKDATTHITTLYNMTREEREKLGKEGYSWAHSEEAGFTSPQMAKRVINSVDKLFKSWEPRPNYEFINANEIEEDRAPHKLLY
jgi:glycosyltransferase involved in cell wall biosynthesis